MRLLVTGANGLIGSEVVGYFAEQGWETHGIDNNMRASFFGPEGDTRWNQRRLLSRFKGYRHHELDIRDRPALLALLGGLKPDLLVHAAAQPSHDLAAQRPFDDFDVNAVGTLNLLEAVRQGAPQATFVFFSTNKVYGDAPNEIPVVELATRWDYADAAYRDGIREDFRVDQSTHSLFGAAKLAADVMVQEYGRYFGLRCCCLRAGCLTGPSHSGVELHGFLSYLVKCNLEGRLYRVYGYKGKQVRDNVHARDVARFIAAFAARPRIAEVYNLGGGRQNSCSVLEAFALAEKFTGKRMNYEYVDAARRGDHRCYISNLSKMKAHYPEWDITVPLPSIIEEVSAGWRDRLSA